MTLGEARRTLRYGLGMPKNVQLDRDRAEGTLRMLTALKAILDSGPLSSEQYAALEPAIGDEVIRYGNPLGVDLLKDTIQGHRRDLIEAIGSGNLIDPGLAR